MTTPVDHPAPQRVRAGVVGLLATTLAGGAAWLFLRSGDAAPEPPSMDRSRVPAEIAEHIAEGRQQVLEEPSSAEAWGQLGMVFRAYDFEAESLACFAQAEHLNPHDERWPYLRALSLAIADPAVALDCYRRAVHADPEFLHARFHLAELLLTLDRVPEAEEHVYAAQRVAPQHPRTHLLLARLEWFRRDLPACVEWARKSAEGAPGQRATRELLARAHYAVGDAEAAAEELELLAKLPPGRTTWHDPLVDEILELRRDAVSAALQAQRLLAQGQSRRGLRLLADLVQRHPENVAFHARLGQALLVAGAHTEAARALDESLERHADSAELRRLRGIAHFKAGQWAQAAERFREAIDRKPDSALAWDNLGTALVKLDKPDAARDAFERAVQLDPGLVSAQASLGRLLLEAGRREEALWHLRAAVQLAPDETSLRKLLAEAGG